jgi:hypothetical protein
MAACKGKVQNRGNFNGVLEKHFVKIAQAEKENLPLMITLDSPVLFDHGA